MNIWDTNIYIKLFHIIFHSIKEKKDLNYLFVGKVSNEIEKILLKLNNSINYNKLSKKEQDLLKDTYGEDVEKELKTKLKDDTELIFEYIHFDDNIETIKKKIYIHLSNIQKNLILYPEDQYLFVKNVIDNRFYHSIISYLFLDSSILKSKEIEDELSRILNKEIKLKKKKYYINELKTELVNSLNSLYSYDLPVSINFIDKSSNNIVIEYADLIKNDEYDNVKNDRIESNDYYLINNFECNETIHLYHRDDVEENLENKDYILERYFENVKNKERGNFKDQQKEYLELFDNIDKKYENIYNHLSNNINKEIKEKKLGDFHENINNYINGFILLGKSLLDLDINLIKLFDLLKLDEIVPYLNYIAKRKRNSKIKLYEPVFKGDKATIRKEELEEWNELNMDVEEKNNFSKNNFIVFKLKYNNSYITILLEQTGTLLLKNLSSKDKILKIDLLEIIDLVNNNIIKKINKTLGIEKNNLDKIQTLEIENLIVLQINFSKTFKLSNVIDSDILKNLINYYNEFIYFKSKQVRDSYEQVIKKKKNNYSIKRINSFGSVTLIEKYISKLLLDSSNRINGNEIEIKIKNCFNLSTKEAKDIYSSLIKSLEDQANRSEKDKGDILGILKKKLKKEEENVLIQYNDLRDLVVFNISFIKDFNEIRFISNFIDLILKEFLLEKVYKKTKEQKEIQKQEQKLEDIFSEQIVKKQQDFGSVKTKKVFDFSDSENSDNDMNSDNSNNSNKSNENDNNDNNDNNKYKNLYKNNLEEQKDDASENEDEVELNFDNLKENSIEEQDVNVEELEFDNLKEYFTEMRAKYDPELFSSGRKSKIASISKSSKGEESKVDYTSRCQSVNDKFPIIISKNKLKEIQNNPKYLEGLDIYFFEDKKDKIGKKATYFLEGGKNKRNIYICPRIWCVKCEIPISPIDFLKNQECPKCKGGIIKDKREKITNDNTVYVRKHNVTWKDEKKTSVLQKYIEKLGKEKKMNIDELKIPYDLSGSQKGMYPYYIKSKEVDKGILLTCCGSKTTELLEGDQKEIKKPESLKSVKKSLISDKGKFSFLTKKENIEEYRLAIPTDDINLLFDNSSVLELRDFKKIESQVTKYYFNYLGLRREYKLDEMMTNTKKFVRLGIIGEDYFPNNSIISCLNTLIHCIKLDSNKNEPKRNFIVDSLEDTNIFKPSLFIGLVNGNIVELFRDENNIKKLIPDKNKISGKNEEILKNLLNFIEIFNLDLKLINLDTDLKEIKGNLHKLLELNYIQELYNLYTAFDNFIKYSKSDDIYKNPEYYTDLLGIDNFIFTKGLNVYVIEKENKYDVSKISLICPTYYDINEYYKKENNIVLIKIKKNFEPLININFKKDKKDSENINYIYNNNNKYIEKLKKIISKNCKSKNNNIDIPLYELEEVVEIKYYIKGKYPKIIAVILKDNIFVKINPCGIKQEYFTKLLDLNKINRKDLISFEQYNKLPDSKKDKDLIKNLNLLNTNDKINNGLISSLEKSIDNLIFDDIVEKDVRMIYAKKYQNNIREFNNILLGVNRYLLDTQNSNVKDNLIKILKNPVYPLFKKKNDIRELFNKNKIFKKLFHFQNDYFNNSVEIISCYNKTEDELILDKDNIDKYCHKNKNEYKVYISKNNLVNENDLNEEFFLTLLIEKIIRKISYGLKLCNTKLEEYTIKSLSSLEKKHQMEFKIDSLDRVLEKLYQRKKVKFVRDIDTKETKKNLLELEASNISDDFDESSIQNDFEQYKHKNKKYLIQSFKTPNKKLDIKANDINMFGIKDLSQKVMTGKCQFPFHIRSLTKERKSTNWKKHIDCVPTQDGPICATKINKRINVRGRKKPLYEYLETDKKLSSRKGYCNWNDYFKREISKDKYKDLKKNPNCIKDFKLKKKEKVAGKLQNKIISMSGCLPEQTKYIDKEDPKFICPVETNKEGFFENKHKFEDCFIKK